MLQSHILVINLVVTQSVVRAMAVQARDSGLDSLATNGFFIHVITVIRPLFLAEANILTIHIKNN